MSFISNPFPLAFLYFLSIIFINSLSKSSPPKCLSPLEVTTSTFLSGLFFELPIVMYILAKIGILGPDILKKYRKHSLVAILILSALITPPDVVSQLLVSFPIYALYEFGIIIVKRVEKKRKKDLENEQNTNTD